MFSGRWDQSVKRDAQGCIFLDFNPSHFQTVLTYLRSLAIHHGNADITPPPCLAFEDQGAFYCLVDYLGLDGHLKSSAQRQTQRHRCCSELSFSHVGEGILVSRGMTDGRWTESATVQPSDEMEDPGLHFMLAGEPMTPGQVHYRKIYLAGRGLCKAGRAQGQVPSREMFIGITEHVEKASGYDRLSATSFGWDATGYQYKAGCRTAIPKWSGLSLGSGPVILQIDLQSRQLWMKGRNSFGQNQTRCMSLPEPSCREFVLQVILYLCKETVKLLPVTESDRQLFAH